MAAIVRAASSRGRGVMSGTRTATRFAARRRAIRSLNCRGPIALAPGDDGFRIQHAHRLDLGRGNRVIGADDQQRRTGGHGDGRLNAAGQGLCQPAAAAPENASAARLLAPHQRLEIGLAIRHPPG